MRTLTARLIATMLVLVAVASVAIGSATTFVMRSYLMDRLDRDVTSSLMRAARPLPGIDMSIRQDGGDGDGIQRTTIVRGQGIDTLTAVIAPNGTSSGSVLLGDDNGLVVDRQLTANELATLAKLPTHSGPNEPVSVDVPNLGTYRVAVVSPPGDRVRLYSGLPQSRVDDPVASLIQNEVMLVLLALSGAGFAGLVLVRRQLAPLREVAETAEKVSKLPLSSGDVDVSIRVANADERNEVGQVGAAINTMLAHVEQSLEARHRSEQQVRQFVADASHELRTPLSTIRGYSALATAHPDDLDTLRESLSKVSSESERMSSLVDDLLLLARLDAGRGLERQPVDLTRLAVEVVEDARLLAPDHQWVLDVGDEPVEVIGDERSLRQVVTNLVSNARLHTPGGTTVRVSVRPGEFVVADDGPGFDDPDHALERFGRGDPSRTTASASTGLGLSIVDAIVREHGGSVTIASRPGESAVTVRLPTESIADH
jgi:two-component system OmpR family sensor kinase